MAVIENPCAGVDQQVVIEEGLPPVVPDWDEQVKRAEAVCRLVDRHLNTEAKGRLLLDLNDFKPEYLCPEQRVQMVTDCVAQTVLNA